MGYSVPKHRLQAMDTEGMAEVVQMRSAVAFVPMHDPAVEKYFPEVVVYRGLFITARSPAAFEKEVFRNMHRIDPAPVPPDIFHDGTTDGDVAVLIVFRVYDVQDIFIHVNIFHAQAEGFRNPKAASILDTQDDRIKDVRPGRGRTDRIRSRKNISYL